MRTDPDRPRARGLRLRGRSVQRVDRDDLCAKPWRFSCRGRAGPPGGLQVMGAMGRGDAGRRGGARRHDCCRFRRASVGLLHAGSRRLLGNVPAARADCDAFQAGLGALPRRAAGRRPRDGDSARRTPGGTHPDGRLRRNSETDI